MRSYHVRPGGGLASLQIREHETPQPQARQVVVKIHAVSLNYRERMIIVDGAYPLPLKPDLVPVCDGAGAVVAIGEDVSRVAVGERVAASVFARWLGGEFSFEVADQLGGSLDGMLTEYALLDEDALVRIPAHLSYEEASTFPCAGVTAWNALTWGDPLQPGQNVLVIGSGSVALFAVQFAKLFGARVVATTSSPHKAEVLRGIGADIVIDYREVPHWDAAVREATGGGVDRVVETGGLTTLPQSVASVVPNGHIAWVGAFAPNDVAFDPRVLSRGVYALRRIALGSRAHFRAMNRAVAAHGLRPAIDRIFEFDEAEAAFRYAFERDGIGKVVVRVTR
jgi:NADPH:quinone reductase-like Zn-dependent oxidoreductase